MSRIPRVGSIRAYDGATPSVYPGETAEAMLTTLDLLAIANGETVSPTSWLISPTPGFAGWYLRTRYRLVGRWLERIGIGRPKLVATATIQKEP